MSRTIDKWRRGGTGLMLGLAVAAGLLSLASCRPAFPRELFVISGRGADYPIMLSQTPAASGGRKIQAASGTSVYHYQQRYYGYTDRSQSELPASTQFNAQVLRTDRWVQVEHVEFYSSDFTTYSNTAHLRKLTIAGTVFP
jgi:hypothetical protein